MRKLYYLTLLSGIFSSAFSQDKTASVNFDGVDDYIVVQDHSSLNFGRSAFTIEAWFSVDTGLQSSEGPILVSKKGLSGSSMDGFLFGLNNGGKVSLQLEGTSYSPGFGGGGPGPGTSAHDLRDGACHHIAWVREVGGTEDTVLAYEDGQYVKKTRKKAGLADVSTPDDLWIGWSEDFATALLYQWQGQIKEVRIWNVARTEAQITGAMYTHLVGNESGLVAYWRLNENFGETVYDCAPNGLNGLRKNGASWMTFPCDDMTGATANCANGAPLGIGNVEKSAGLSIFPNPANNLISLSNQEGVKIQSVMIYDMHGKLVMTEIWDGNSPLNVSQLKSGTYIVSLQNENQSLTRNVISIQ